MSNVTDEVLSPQPSRKEHQAGEKGRSIAATKAPKPLTTTQGRLLSLDAFRGITMFLLIAEGAGVYHALQNVNTDSALLSGLLIQFTHQAWTGLHFWDLVQPFFMFIVGVAMPFAFAKRWERGDSWIKTFRHVLKRSFLLLLLGVGLYCIFSGKLVFELWNVLAQLSFTYLVAFLIMRKSAAFQLTISFAFLLFTQLAYFLWPVPGFDQPFVPDHNVGAYVDLLVTGHLSGGHWVAINALPTAAHTIWGVLAGQVIKSNRGALKKVKILAVAGLIGLMAGYALAPFIPIIKRICTSSFVIVSGGWCLLALAFLYWLIEIKRIRKWSLFFVIVGMNPLFIYLFSLTISRQWLNAAVGVFTSGFLGWMGSVSVGIITALVVLGIQWYLCYWLYQRDIFLKI